MSPLSEFLPDLVALRQELHHMPEISGKEIKTALLIRDACSSFSHARVVDRIGKTGLAVVFDSGKPGRTVMLRADMDALAMEEDIDIPYISPKKSLSHKCGHDGHMAILVGTGHLLQKHPPRKGRVVLLFQPAEETGRGALAMVNDPKFRELTPDFIFALHNLPGFTRHTVILREGTFAMASVGLHVRLKGHAAHAAFPEQGISPLPAMIDLFGKLQALPQQKKKYRDYVQLSLTFAQSGRVAFGTIPGMAEIGMTLRATCENDLKILESEVKKLVAAVAGRYFLEEQVTKHEPFTATLNDHEAVEAIRNVAIRHHFPVVDQAEPFRWSEDFGVFTSRFRGAIFGLGAGENHSDLHTWYYDFPDDIMETGIRMFFGLVQDLTND
jgi:amidohydrolase